MEAVEYETKVLGIDPQLIINKLRKFGAKEEPEILKRRLIFDMKSENSEWVRLRDNGDKVTLTYKYKVIGNTQIGKTTEIEVDVSDFEKTARILKKLPFYRIFYQENKSHIFHLNGIEFSIDTWPMIPPYLEIESNSKEKVIDGLKLLDLLGKDSGDRDLKDIYRDKGMDLHSYTRLKF